MYNEPRYPAPEPDPNKGHGAIRRRAVWGAGPPFGTDQCLSMHTTVSHRTMAP